MCRFALLATLPLFVGACVHNVQPKITPAKVTHVEPPIHARVLLLITPSFETYTTQSSSGIHTFNYRMGEAAANGLADMITKSFDHADVRRVPDAESIQWLAGARDTNVADFLIIPHFETGAYSEGAVKISADVRLRCDVRSYRAVAPFSWTTVGHTARVLSSRGGLTGSALEQALGALADTLRAHRAELDVSP